MSKGIWNIADVMRWARRNERSPQATLGPVDYDRKPVLTPTSRKIPNTAR